MIELLIIIGFVGIGIIIITAIDIMINLGKNDYEDRNDD